ncbi:MAG: radical SAM protein [Candidatus Howiella sp.]|jgi:DNA repair photolyase
MPVIYEPKGKAREYSPYACNLYIGCSHRCQYCYAPHALQRAAENYFGLPEPRKNILRYLEKDLQARRYSEQILLSFIGDVYCENADHSRTTRAALQLLNQYGAPVAVLSKGGERILRDLDVFQAFGSRIAVGATLTFFDEKKSREWESGAASPGERMAVLKALHEAGVRTFASLEPVIDPAESLRLIEQTLAEDSIDHYKIGKLNNYKGLDRGVDWPGFLQEAVNLLRPAGKQVYIKESLREVSPAVRLLAEEVDPERYIVRA